jgi:hypothetical protein
MTEQEVRQRFRDLVGRYGDSLEEAGKKLGYSRQFIGQIIAGQRNIPEPLLAEMGLRRKVIYEEAQ